MAQVLTFLGKGGSGRSTVAIAAAKKLAGEGVRVLLISSDPSPAFGLMLGVTLEWDPLNIGANLWTVQLQATYLIEKAWEEVKQLEAKYLRSPTLKNVYGQELSLFPGMDTALYLNAIREYNASGRYDVIVYDGSGDLTTLRMLGIPENASWYFRRFRQVFRESDFGKALSPFVQPVSAALFNVSWSFDDFAEQPTQEVTSLLEQGKAALSDPKQVLAYLVTTEQASAIAQAQYLWGSAQQVGLSVGGVIANTGGNTGDLASQFAPLTVTPLPRTTGDDWQTLMEALPALQNPANVPQPISVDVSGRQVRVFLPGFDKKQVKLTQYGPEITIEAGDQRRNITLPHPLTGCPVKGAKFQDSYLVISV
ncbi:ArsA family ATPase [Spirulina subsalsa]|uniref:Get3/ArsA fold putative tail anchor-mediating ATPase NosAFP n=1 Tax=Spirulina subsalsa TaxID=54311 RepID=UPI0002F627C5|nr:ArsA family ATPase [Spirulina subsalsa]